MHFTRLFLFILSVSLLIQPLWANNKRLLETLAKQCKQGDIRACVKKGVLEKNVKVKVDCDKALDDDCFALAPAEEKKAKDEVTVLKSACEAELWVKCYNLALKYEQKGNRKLTKKYRNMADRLHRFINQKLVSDGLLQRTDQGGAAELADYAHVAAGLLAYAEMTGQELHYNQSIKLVEKAWERFYLDGFWRRSENLDLLLPFTVYPVTLPDKELPSASATLVRTTLQLAKRIDPAYRQLAHRALHIADNDMVESPFFYATQIAILASMEMNTAHETR